MADSDDKKKSESKKEEAAPDREAETVEPEKEEKKEFVEKNEVGDGATGGEEETEDTGDDWWGGASGWMNSALSSVSQATTGAVAVAKSKSNEVYGFVSKDLKEVSSHVGSAATTVKKSLEVRDKLEVSMGFDGGTNAIQAH